MYSQIGKPLQPPVDGSFNMLSHSDKTFTILLNGKEEVVSINRLKAAFVEETPNGSLNKHITPERPIQHRKILLLLFLLHLSLNSFPFQLVLLHPAKPFPYLRPLEAAAMSDFLNVLLATTVFRNCNSFVIFDDYGSEGGAFVATPCHFVCPSILLNLLTSTIQKEWVPRFFFLIICCITNHCFPFHLFINKISNRDIFMSAVWGAERWSKLGKLEEVIYD